MSQPIIPPPAAAVLATGLTEKQQRERDPDEARDVEDATAVAVAARACLLDL